MIQKKHIVMAWWAFLVAAWTFLSIRYFQRGDVVGGVVFAITVLAVVLLIWASTKGFLCKK